MATTTRSVNQTVGYVFGATYLLVGLVGFAVTSGVGFADADGKNLILFQVNPLHNVVHLLVGGLLLAGARGGVRTARSINTLVGAVYLLVGVLGLFAPGRDWNILAINHADNLLHFASAALLLGVGLGADRATRRAPAEDALRR